MRQFARRDTLKRHGILCPATLGLIFCALIASGGQADRLLLRRLERIASSMQRQRLLAPSDKKFLIHTLDSSSAEEKRIAIADLAIAVAYKEFPKQVFLTLLERMLLVASPSDAPFYLFEFGVTLGVDNQPKGAMLDEYEALNEGTRRNTTVDQAEKQFIAKALSGKNGTNNVLAARIIVQKRDLDSASKAWTTGLIARQIATSTPGGSRYWRLVRRIMLGRVRHHR